jgi:hypothetical protein
MSHPTPIDITNIPELVRIAEEVEATKKPRELKRENKIVAVIRPAKQSAPKKRGKSETNYEAFRAAFGSWSDVDTESLLKNIYADRRQTNTRPPVKL